jgi:uncharacterized membrane protein YeiH
MINTAYIRFSRSLLVTRHIFTSSCSVALGKSPVPSITMVATRSMSSSVVNNGTGSIVSFGHVQEQSSMYRFSVKETVEKTPNEKVDSVTPDVPLVDLYDVNVDVLVKQHHDDGLPRYPEFDSVNGLLRFADWVGTVSFAVTGTITAGIYGMDFLGCVLVGTITATGGGTLRDMFLGNTPVAFLLEVEYLAMCVVAALLTFYLWKECNDRGIIKLDGPVLWWTDTLGIGAFAVIGAQNGIRRHMHPLACIACGMFTATFGGVMRDILVKKDVRIMHSHAELYATSAILGSSAYCAVKALGGTPAMRILGGVGTGMMSRYVADKYKLRLPRAPWEFDYPKE